MKQIILPDYEGHRQRLRKRFFETNGIGMADYELLEMILFESIPRRDVKPIAKELLRKFGNLAEVLNASEKELMSVRWITERSVVLFKLFVATTKRICYEKLADKQNVVLTDVEGVVDYLRAAIAYSDVEEVHLLYLDARFCLIGAETLQRGSLTGVNIIPSEIVRKAMERKSPNIILAHNHPSGSVEPSGNDIRLTKDIKEACRLMGISLQDHIIISKSEYLSFREEGIIRFD